MPLNGQRLKSIREARGYTQEELADLIGVGTVQIYRWETEKNDPTGDMLVKLSKILNVTTDYLLDLTPEIDATRSDALSSLETKILVLFRAKKFFELIALIVEHALKQYNSGQTDREHLD